MLGAGGRISMADFKFVFSTTVKVLLSLLAISAILALVLGAFGSLAMLSNPSTSTAATTVLSSAPIIDAADEKADAYRTSMPKSAWDRGMARAFRHHCYVAGMSHEEVLKAIGTPSAKDDWGQTGSAWTWDLAPGPCLKYDGEKCIERKKRQQIVFFTAKGYLRDSTAECQILDREASPQNPAGYIDASDLFGKGEWK